MINSSSENMTDDTTNYSQDDKNLSLFNQIFFSITRIFQRLMFNIDSDRPSFKWMVNYFADKDHVIPFICSNLENQYIAGDNNTQLALLSLKFLG